MITVSVILTTYNSEHSVHRALQSVYNQRGLGVDFELQMIVVDDCSTDATLEVINEFPAKVFSTSENSGGPNKGRNIGLQQATGDFIIIMDHDDEWLPDRILRQLAYADNFDIITCGYVEFDEDSNEEVRRVVNSGADEMLKYARNETFRDKISKTKGKQINYLGSVMYSSRLKHIRFEEHFGQIDFDWITRLFYSKTSVEVCKPLYNRYVASKNLSLNKVYRRRDYYYSLMCLEDFEEEFPNETRLGRKRINGTRARYHYVMNEMKQARRYFLRSEISLKTCMYILTSYYGHEYVNKNFHVFG